MKIKETKSGNYKITMSQEELDLFVSITSIIQLGTGPNSDIAQEFFEIASPNNCITQEIGFNVDIQSGQTPELQLIID